MANCERILVVEDEPDLRDLTAELVELRGVTVVRSGSAAEALAALRAGPRPDLILLDLAMPAISGPELLSIVRADDRWRSIPVVAMSGYPEAHFPRLSVDAFLLKPFDADELQRVIDRLCGTASTVANA